VPPARDEAIRGKRERVWATQGEADPQLHEWPPPLARLVSISGPATFLNSITKLKFLLNACRSINWTSIRTLGNLLEDV
jgi:hypothetical protein